MISGSSLGRLARTVSSNVWNFAAVRSGPGPVLTWDGCNVAMIDYRLDVKLDSEKPAGWSWLLKIGIKSRVSMVRPGELETRSPDCLSYLWPVATVWPTCKVL